MYANQNPIRFNDPTGHDAGCMGMDCGDLPSSYKPPVYLPITSPTPKTTPRATYIPTITPTPTINWGFHYLGYGSGVTGTPTIPWRLSTVNPPIGSPTPVPPSYSLGPTPLPQPTPTPMSTCPVPQENTWTLFSGMSGSVTNPNEIDTVAGKEYIRGNINTNYSYSGQGFSIGEGGFYSYYAGFIHNINSSSDWEGPTHTVVITGALGPVGVTFGFEQGDTKGSPFGFFVGYAVGADASVSFSDTYVTGQ